MARKAFMKGLQELNEMMSTMAEMAELAIRKAVRSLQELDAGDAEEVAVLDREIYALQIENERKCADLLALHAPVARDLRTIMTSLKITTDLDRISRYALDITEATMAMLATGELHPKKLVSIPHMADLTIAMVDKAVKAFVNRDAESVRNIFKEDDSIDALHDEIFREQVTYMMDRAEKIETGARYILVSRYLERISDHACNIGERVVYMVTGERMERA